MVLVGSLLLVFFVFQKGIFCAWLFIIDDVCAVLIFVLSRYVSYVVLHA